MKRSIRQVRLAQRCNNELAGLIFTFIPLMLNVKQGRREYQLFKIFSAAERWNLTMGVGRGGTRGGAICVFQQVFILLKHPTLANHRSSLLRWLTLRRRGD